MKGDYERDGYLLVKGLFPREEAEVLRDHYMALHADGGRYCEGGVDPLSTDPLVRYPRMMHPHHTDPTSMGFMIDPRIRTVFLDLLGRDPYGMQTMVYFKPPGARGQAFHQDQRYLAVKPGTCHAAWMALDDIDEENGCLRVVRGSHDLPVLCPIKSDTEVSFTSERVPLPPGVEIVDVIMEPGDVLFFHGNLIHGSEPNVSKDRFRRIVVAHYAEGEAESIVRYCDPSYDMEGRPISIRFNETGGPCGTFTPQGGVEMTSTVVEALAAH